MSEYWDYKSKASAEYKQGYEIISGWHRMNFYAENGTISQVICWYWNNETKKYEGEAVKVTLPITTFCGYLKALEVGVIRVNKSISDIKEIKLQLPPMSEFVLMDNMKRYFNK